MIWWRECVSQILRSFPWLEGVDSGVSDEPGILADVLYTLLEDPSHSLHMNAACFVKPTRTIMEYKHVRISCRVVSDFQDNVMFLQLALLCFKYMVRVTCRAA